LGKHTPAVIQLAHSSLPPRDAWNSLGKMSREEAMSAYITEMKLVAQKVERAEILCPQASSQVACPSPFQY
jgi:hypothetical protein